MADRSWFFASQGQQQGPFPEARLREFIAAGAVTAETLVWTEGMANWQKAGEIPGLLSGAMGPPASTQPGDQAANAEGRSGGPLSIELGLWPFLGWTLLYPIALVLVIPAPWVATGYYRWIDCAPSRAGAAQPRLHRPGARHLVRVRRGGALDGRGVHRHPVSAIPRYANSGVSVMDDRAMDCRESFFSRPRVADHL